MMELVGQVKLKQIFLLQCRHPFQNIVIILVTPESGRREREREIEREGERERWVGNTIVTNMLKQ